MVVKKLKITDYDASALDLENIFGLNVGVYFAPFWDDAPWARGDLQTMINVNSYFRIVL